jgi:hypothetical protein
MLLVLAPFLMIRPGTASTITSVKVEAVGFFTHPPMWETRDTIQKVCKEFPGKVDLVMYNEMSDEGRKFMQSKGLKGHLPMVLYVNGSIAHKINNQVIVFRDFVGQSWKAENLEQVIKLNLDGKKTAVAAPPNATTEAWGF